MAEIAIAAAGIVISPIVQVFFENMASGDFVDLFRGRKLDDGLLTRFKIKLLSVNAVLKDAEDKQFTRHDVKVWVDAVYDAVYDAEQVLDEISTKAHQRKWDAEFGNFGSMVRNSISRSTSRFVKKVEKQIEKLLVILDDLVNEKDNLGLREGVEGNPSERLPTTSLVDESRIFGRDDDKKAIINSLLSNGASGADETSPGVIAIVGMGGIGKTTLAQLVYNDDSLKDHFTHKAWVCVPDPFNVFIVMRAIIKAVTGQTPCDIEELDQLQNELKKRLTGKKFLVVLDDVWEKNDAKWEVLRNALKFGAQGSKVIVTTRDHEVARIMHGKYHPITDLSKNDCLSLFAKYALIPNGNYNAYPQLKEIGSQIIEKCKGLPLAITAIGALLRSNLCVDEWDKVLRSELWDSPINHTAILPALILSYKYLSPPLRRCFAYCSIFPKDHAFKKDELVLLWMAEGFLFQPQNKTMEEEGDDYFLALVSRSLFQRSKSNEPDEYVMHDLVSDLAKFISKEFTLCHKDDNSREILSKTCHFSSSQNFDIKKLKTFHKSMRLRTIIDLNKFSINDFGSGLKFLLPLIRCLRVLILSHGAISELPDSIGKLKHLRYLSLFFLPIKRLPDSICNLCNLQILKLSHCYHLAALPRDMHKLINLRHLDIVGTGITEMPINLGKLKCLQMLPKFIVSNSGCGIEELGKLTNLRGSLSVLGLQNIESPTAAEGRNLRALKYLENLVLEWKDDTNASESHKIVLDSLQSHTNLKSLTIRDFGGTSFPDWVGNASFSNIASLCLENCKFCCSLPPLGQLPFLQDLSIIGLDGVVAIDRQFYGSGSPSMKPFGALKSLRFSRMREWKEWSPFEAENEGRAFPNLRDLSIFDCHKLTSGLPTHLPSLAELFIENCPQLVASIPRASFLHKLTFLICNTVLLNEQFYYSSLEKLTLYTCGFLKSFPIPLFPKLHCLEISNCEDLESLTVGEQHEQDLLLSQIEINQCPNFAYFPHGGLRASNLKVFSIHDCRSLRSLPEKMHILLPSLDKLSISHCPQVESFLEGGLPSNLNVISIFHCDKLFASRLGWGLQTLPCVRRFSISDKSEDVESFPDEGLLPNNLTYLHIKLFPNLKYLNLKGLQHLTALEELEIRCCPELECMLEDGLPASLSTIRMYGCPLLEKELERKEGEEWVKIAHVPYKYIGLMR